MSDWIKPRQLESHLPDDNRDSAFLEFYREQVGRYDCSETFLGSFCYAFDPKQSVLEAAPEIAEIPLLRGLVFWFLQEHHGISEDICSHLILAYEEVIANVVKHSYSESDTKWLKTRIYCEGTTLQMEIHDRGEGGRDPELSKILDDLPKTGRPPLRRRGGLGLYLMKRITDELTYTPGETNVLRMVKHLGGS